MFAGLSPLSCMRSSTDAKSCAVGQPIAKIGFNVCFPPCPFFSCSVWASRPDLLLDRPSRVFYLYLSSIGSRANVLVSVPLILGFRNVQIPMRLFGKMKMADGTPPIALRSGATRLVPLASSAMSRAAARSIVAANRTAVSPQSAPTACQRQGCTLPSHHVCASWISRGPCRTALDARMFPSTPRRQAVRNRLCPCNELLLPSI